MAGEAMWCFLAHNRYCVRPPQMPLTSLHKFTLPLCGLCTLSDYRKLSSNKDFDTASTKQTFQPQEHQATHQEMRDPNVTSLYFATPLAFNAPKGGVPLGRSP